MKSLLAFVFAGLILNIVPVFSQNNMLFSGHVIPNIGNFHTWYEFLEIDTKATIDGKNVALKQTIFVDKYSLLSVIDDQVNYLSLWKVTAIDWPVLALYIENDSGKKISKYSYFEYIDGKWNLVKYLVGSGDAVADTQELNKFLKEKYRWEWKYPL